MSITEVSEDFLEVARRMGFKGKVFWDSTEKGAITLVSGSCDMCDKPWTVKVCLEGEPGEKKLVLYLCDECFKRARKRWPRKPRVVYIR